MISALAIKHDVPAAAPMAVGSATDSPRGSFTAAIHAALESGSYPSSAIAAVTSEAVAAGEAVATADAAAPGIQNPATGKKVGAEASDIISSRDPDLLQTGYVDRRNDAANTVTADGKLSTLGKVAEGQSVVTAAAPENSRHALVAESKPSPSSNTSSSPNPGPTQSEVATPPLRSNAPFGNGVADAGVEAAAGDKAGHANAGRNGAAELVAPANTTAEAPVPVEPINVYTFAAPVVAAAVADGSARIPRDARLAQSASMDQGEKLLSASSRSRSSALASVSGGQGEGGMGFVSQGAVRTETAMTVLFGAALSQGAPIATPLQGAESISSALLDTANGDEWIDQLAHDIAATQNDDGLLNFTLLPRHLGRINVTMQQGNEGLAFHIAAENEAALGMLVAVQGKLIDELRQNGVRVASADVSTGGSGTSTAGQGGEQRAPSRPYQPIETAPPAAGANLTRTNQQRGRLA